MITAKAIEKAVREVAEGKRKGAELKDPGDRGAGRLAVVVKPRTGKRAVAEFYASSARCVLDRMAADIGPDRPAASIIPDDIIAYLAKVLNGGGGKPHNAYAARSRAYARAAFAWAMGTKLSYTGKSPGRDWGIESNPAAAVMPDDAAIRPRDRWLQPWEVKIFWDWLCVHRIESMHAGAAQLRIVTGQRSEEILRISADTYDLRTHTVFWEKTKSGRPHRIPLPQHAIEILRWIKPRGPNKLYFWNRKDKARPAAADGISTVVEVFLAQHPTFQKFVPTDLRRTFKTLGYAP
jgi:integrase